MVSIFSNVNRAWRSRAGAGKGVHIPQQQEETAPPPAESPDAMAAKIAQLKELGELKAQGILTEAEFEAQKAQLLGT